MKFDSWTINMFYFFFLICRHLPEYEESGETDSGLIFHNNLSIPYVSVNGFKYTLLKDILPLFNQDCQHKCQIPRNVLKRHPGVLRTFCTWDQVGFYYVNGVINSCYLSHAPSVISSCCQDGASVHCFAVNNLR